MINLKAFKFEKKGYKNEASIMKQKKFANKTLQKIKRNI